MSNFKSRVRTGRQKRSMRSVIFGPVKCGKSELAARFPKPLTLSFDDGVSSIDTASIVPTSWYDTLTILSELHAEGMEGHGFQTLNIDPVGWCETFCAKQLCVNHSVDNLGDIGGGFGNWKEALFAEFAQLTDWTDALHAQGMHINFIAHERIIAFKDPGGADYNRYTMLMKNEDLAGKLRQSVDNVLFINFDTKGVSPKKNTAAKATGTGRRVMYTTETPAFSAGNRFNLPSRIEMSPNPDIGFKNFWQHYEAWSEDVGANYEVQQEEEVQ